MHGIRELIAFLENRGRQLSLESPPGKIRFTTTDGRSISCDSVLEAVPFLENNPAPVRWELVCMAPRLGEKVTSKSLRIFIDHDSLGALISVDSDDSDLLGSVFRQIERGFGFERLPVGINRVKYSPHATALIGCHFDNLGVTTARRLQRFLSLIGFARVDIADTVRASSIQDKIRELLEKNSFYIGIITGTRDHDWITAESSYALAKGKEVVLILQNGSKFNPTFYGRDREHLSFDHSIDESFIGILENFRSLGVLGLM